jgi:hypothetical protein
MMALVPGGAIGHLLKSYGPFSCSYADFVGSCLEVLSRDHIADRRPLYTNCYDEFNDLVSEGLGHDISLDANISASIGKMMYPQRAWAFAMGACLFIFHAWYNYEYYYDTLTRRSNENSHVFVIRQEFLHKDWGQVDRMFGGDGTAPDSLLGTRINANPNKAGLLGTNLQQLCRALCRDIQFYKRLLEAAANLDDNDVEESMQELRTYCPDEVSSVRACSNMPTFPPPPPGEKSYAVAKNK